MAERSIQQQERRREKRRTPSGAIRVARAVPVMPISDAQVLNISPSGVAIRTAVPLKPGDRLSFSIGQGKPPLLAEVLAVEKADDGFRVRCRCLLGGFE